MWPGLPTGDDVCVARSNFSPEHNELARRFRALSSAYESNRDLVLMGAYRPGADPLVDRGIAMHQDCVNFLTQRTGEHVSFDRSADDLARLIGHEG